MALTNRDRIDRAQQTLAVVLGPALDRATADRLPQGTSWADVLYVKDGSDPNRKYDVHDPRLQLRAATVKLGDFGYIANGFLSRGEQSMASELRDVLNDHAHGKTLSTDDTHRALDTMERLLRALQAPDKAREIEALKKELLRKQFSEQARYDTRQDVDLADVELPAWHEVLRPHPDVLSGKFQESEFAANLHAVASGQGDVGAEYSDPVEFFRRTYLTAGLEELLQQAVRRVAGTDNGAPVVNLQTTFGGGKTHSMLAVWHLFSGVAAQLLPDEVQRIAAEGDLDRITVRRAAIVGNELAPGSPETKPDGTVVHTLWGELAWQLDGAEGYAHVADADASGTNPGAGLRRLLDANSPCVILIDEWVAYARQLVSRDNLPAGSFETQFTFAQQLSEAVSTTPGALLLVSIPASDVRLDASGEKGETAASELETGGEHGREALRRLEHVIGRSAHQWRSATHDESFEIVRRRLFEEPDDRARRTIAQTARRFRNFYQQHVGELPRGSESSDYEERIRRAFPIHPELFDRLYEDWSTLERFQRTRGVLRLMSTVIATLTASGDGSPLIMPGGVPVGASAVEGEFFQYLDPAWRAVIDSDVDGGRAVPRQIDAERPLFGKRALTTRIARALFMGSAPTLNTANRGLDRKRLTLGVALPADTLGNMGSAIAQLGERSSYVFQDGERLWLDITPSLNRRAADIAASLDDVDVEAEILRRLRTASSDTGRLFHAVIVAPPDGASVPESDETRLVVLGPDHAHDPAAKQDPAAAAAVAMTTSRGSAAREYRNTLLFLAPDARRVDELRSTTRTYLAWHAIVDDADRLDLRQEQLRSARSRNDAENEKLGRLLIGTWTIGLAPRQEGNSPDITVQSTSVAAKDARLAVHAEQAFTRADELRATDYAPQLIALRLQRELRTVWNAGRVRARELAELHAKYLYLPRLRSPRVLYNGLESVTDAFVDDAFWLAEGYDAGTGDFTGLAGPGDTFPGGVTPETYVVPPEIARRQREREEAERQAATPTDPGSPTSSTDAPTGPTPPTGGGRRGPASVLPAPITRDAIYSGEYPVDSDDVEGAFAELADAIIGQLIEAGPDVLDITVTIRAEHPDGFGAGVVRAVSENARTLGADCSRFEDR
ncbi:MAG: DUF499 domain-containing protein [Galactobacter sp.]